MHRAAPAASLAVIALVAVAVAQQQIPTGGPIPDRRGFNNSVGDTKLTSQVEEVVRRVAGKLYVIARSTVTSDALVAMPNHVHLLITPKLTSIRGQGPKAA
jgi:hypothetical protein